MSRALRVLIVEDSADDAQLLLCELRAGGFDATAERVETAEAMRAALDREAWDIVISDYQMPRFSGLAALKLLRAHGRDLPFILVSGNVGEELAVEAMQAGANDYVMKDKLTRLVPAVERELREAAGRRERRRVEAEFIASEARYRRLFESARDGILILNADTGTVVDVNPFLIELLRVPREHLVGKKFWEAAGFRAIASDAAEFAALRARSYVRFDNQSLTAADGRRIDVEFVCTVYPVDHHTVMQCSIRDITERKTAEANLRVESAALEAAANAVVITDREGQIEWANRAFTTLTGYTLAEAAGRNPRELLKSGKHERDFYRELWETILAGRVWRGALVNRRKDGSLYTEEMTITPVRDEAGRLAHFIAIKQDITARQQAEEKLRLFRELIDHSHDAIEVIDPATGRFVEVNDTACQTLGYTRDELLGLTLFDVDPGLNRGNFAATTARLKGAGHLTMEGRHRRKDGTTYPVEVSLTEVMLDRAYGVTIVRDITERQRAEAALHESEAKFSSAFNFSPVALALTAVADSTFRDVNEAFLRDTGFTREEVIGRSVIEVGTFVDLKERDRLLEGIKQRGQVYGMPCSFRTKSGQTIDCLISSCVVSIGEQQFLLSAILDVTERKATERRLREQNEIISNSHEGVMIVNLDNTVSFWNRGAEAMFGWTATEALGREADQLFGVDGLAVGATARAAVEREGFWNGEMRAQTRDGRRLILDCRMSLVRDDAGRPRARLSFLSDITEKKLLEEKFLHAQRLESIGMLAAGIAHDLNNVLAPIVFAGPLLRESLSTERDLKILNSLEQSAGRGAGLVKQILSFAHSTTGELRPTQVKHLARDIANLIEETFPKSIRLDQQIPANLWVVQGNPTQIHQVLLNLCVNARDAMPQGGTLRLVAENRRLDEAEARTLPEGRPGAWLVLEVADTGTGIAPDVLAHIWEPFFTTKGAGKGTGLGLSTVRGIVASHHGFVTLDTQVGHGTTFRVFLPATEEKPASGGTAPVFAAPAGHDELILVVDDDTAILDTIATILTQHHYRVLCAGDGVEAVSHFTAHPTEIALVITDVDMPLLGGTALARILTQLRADIRLLVMSGLTGEETGGSRSQIAEAKKLSPVFIRKPFTPETLLVAVHELLRPAIKA